MENTNATETKIKKAIIVGASSGIGLATAELLLSKGYEVTNISRTAIDGLDTVIADASKQGEIGRAIEIAAADKPLDTLVYSAGCSMASPIEFADPADYRYLFEVNFFGILEAIKAVTPYMKHGGGRIVLISSMGGTFPIAFDAFYSASKAAVDMIAEAGDLELKPYNIRVCSVRPGGVATKFTFKRNIYGTAAVGDYAEKQKKAVASLAEIEQGGIAADKVAQTVYTMITMPNPPVKVAVGLKNKVFCAAAKLLPGRVIGFFNAVKYDQ